MLYIVAMANNAVIRACEDVGSPANLARLLGIGPSAVAQMCNGDRPVPIERAVQIEQLPDVTVTRIDLRPHDWWRIWPELAAKHPDLIPKQRETANG